MEGPAHAHFEDAICRVFVRVAIFPVGSAVNAQIAHGFHTLCHLVASNIG